MEEIIDEIVALSPDAERDVIRMMLTTVAKRGGFVNIASRDARVAALMEELGVVMRARGPILLE